MTSSLKLKRKWDRWLAFTWFIFLLWAPAISHGVTVWKFIAAQQYGFSVRGIYEVYNMSPDGVISGGGGGVPNIHVFPYNPIQISSYNSIYGKYVLLGTEPLSNGGGAYDPINDPNITNHFQLGAKMPLGYTPSGQSAFFRTISVIPKPEISVRYAGYQGTELVSGGRFQIGNTEIGEERTVTFQIVNMGSLPLTGIVTRVLEDHDYKVTQPASSTLAAGADTTFTVRFRPTGAGTRTGYIRIASNDADENPFNLTVFATATGTINRSIEILGSSGQSLANGSGLQWFEGTQLHSTVSRTVTIRNNGNVPLGNIAASLSGVHAGDFTVTPLSSGTLAVGGTMPLEISFTPTAAGNRNATISVASNASTNNPYTFQITGAAPVSETFDSWVQGTTLVGADAEPDAMPFGDGVPNLLKYAFNLDPEGPDARVLHAGTGTAGLPVHTVLTAGPATSMRIEFLRRKNSGLVYTVKRSHTLAPQSFIPVNGVPLVTPISADWERVVMPVSPAGTPSPTVFCVVEVTQANADP